MSTRPYKNKFYISFYDRYGERLVAIFDNIRDILKYKNIPFTQYEYNKHMIALNRALKTDSHLTFMLTGKLMTVFLVDVDDTE